MRILFMKYMNKLELIIIINIIFLSWFFSLGVSSLLTERGQLCKSTSYYLNRLS